MNAVAAARPATAVVLTRRASAVRLTLGQASPVAKLPASFVASVRHVGYPACPSQDLQTEADKSAVSTPSSALPTYWSRIKSFF